MNKGNDNEEREGGRGFIERLIDRVTGFFEGTAFPVFALAGTGFYLIFLVAAVFWPSGESVWGSFARDFREWCFDYDAATGAMEWNWVWMMLTQPLVLLAIVFYFWWRPLAGSWRAGYRFLAAPSAAGVAFAALIAGVLLVLAMEEEPETLAFPAERIRTALPAPEFSLTNQEGEPVSLADYRGEVVLLTAIYSTCGTACPMLAVQAKRSIEALPEHLRDRITLMAVSLDPEGDTRQNRLEAARSYGLSAPEFHFLNGEPDVVNGLLDRLQVTRFPNRQTGEIDHVNMYFLIDADGTIAYRLNLSDRHGEWLAEGLRLLAEEALEARLALSTTESN